MTNARLLRAQILFAVVALLSSYSYTQTQTKLSRIPGDIDDSRIARVKGNIHPMTRVAQDLGSVDPSLAISRVTLSFKPSAQQQAALDKLLADQYEPSSPQFHQWLTPAQFGDRFGLSTSDFAKVSAWLTSHGLRVVDAPRSRTYIGFSGTAQQISAAFHTPIHQFVVNGEKHFASAAEPTLPAALSGIVQSVGSLNDFRPRPRAAIKRLSPRFTSSLSGNHFVAPDDFATIYNIKSLYNNGNDGTGQTIAVMGQTDINFSDVTTFRSVSNLPANTPTKRLATGGTNPGFINGDILEANLDLQWSGAVAPKASILYVFENNVFNALQDTIVNNLAPIISISYGDCEAHFSANEVSALTTLFQQASTQGQTILAASGDSGAADCDYQVQVASGGLAVDLPAASPNVTAMGGTTFNDGTNPSTYWSATNNANNGSALSYIPEDGWNDTAFELSQGGNISASGGGKSTLFTKPSWQTGTGVPADNARDVPDISLVASPDHIGYLICNLGSCVNGYRDANTFVTLAGGTSAGAPAMAGIVALLNQKAGARQGNINPSLYPLAASAPNSLHDIVTGDNKVPCLSGSTSCPSGTNTIGYSATAGYDYVTGLGTVNVSNLVTQWPGIQAAPDFHGSAALSSMTLTRIGTATSATQNITYTAQNGFTGTINLSCSVSTSLTGVTCGMSPASLTNSGTSVLTVTIPAKSSALTGATVASLSLPFVVGFLFIGGLSTSRRTAKRSSRWLCSILLLTALAFTLTACGGGSDGSPTPTPTALTGTITVQATSGTQTHTVPITITVN